MLSQLLAFLLVIAVLAVYTRRTSLTNPRRLPFPPGPKPYPLLGNVLDMPKTYYWLTFADWAKQYGDVVHLNMLGKHYIILDSFEAVEELLEKRSATYSDRPRMPMMKELMGWEWAMSLLPYGQKWRAQHRIFHQYFHIDTVNSYHGIQLFGTRKTLLQLIQSPHEFDKHIQEFFTSAILKIVYDIELGHSANRSYLHIVEESLKGVSEAGVLGAFLVDTIPLLKYIPTWFPGATFQKKARYWRGLMPGLIDAPFESVQKSIVSGTAGPSVVRSALERDNDDWGDLEELELKIKAVAAISLAAGADTTKSSISTAILALMLHPESQKKAQEELVRVVGRDRLPDFGDLEYLPYIRAIVMEAFRWQPTLPLALAHRAMEDDDYKGYYIPKGAVLMGNTWSILHDEKAYPEPHKFNPERFLNKDGSYNYAVRDPEVAFFGYGRRKCPGRHLARNGSLIFAASLLSCFDITRDLDDDTVYFPHDPQRPVMVSGVMSYPLPYKCKLTPRSNATVQLVKETVRSMEEFEGK